MGNKSSLMLHDEEIKQISEETGFSPTQIEKLFSRFAHLDRGNCGSLNKNDLMSIPELAINPLCDRLIQMFFADCDHDERINFKQFMRVLATFRSNNNIIVSNGNANASLLTAPYNRNKNGNSISRSHSRNSCRDLSLSPEIDRNNVINNSSNANTTVTSRHRRTNNKVKMNLNNNETNDKTPNTLCSNNNTDITINNDRMNEGLRNKLAFVFRVYDADNDGRISIDDLRSILKMMVGNYIEEVQLDKIATRALFEVDEDNDGFIEFSEFCKVFSGKNLDDKLRVKFFN